MNKSDKIYVAGHNGLIGSAIVRRLLKEGYTNILTRSHAELDLTDQYKVKYFFEKEKPEYVFLSAAKGGGVFANNTYRAEFIYENMMIQNNVIHHAFLGEVRKMIFLACGDVYPRNCPQPAKEEYLLTGALEATCEPFALAKIAGIKMCESYNRQYGTEFIVVIPPNIYGPNQHYDMMNAQVLPSLINRFHALKTENADEVVIWGSGSPVRDFLFVDDVADACMFLMGKSTGNDVFNIGTGSGYSILELAEIIKKKIGYKGRIRLDRTKPDGVAKKLLAVSRIRTLGWKYSTELNDGVEITYKAYLNEREKKEVRTSQVCLTTVCEKDTLSINDRKVKAGNTRLSAQPDTYRGRVVIKPWGYEFLVFENNLVAVWLLYIKKGFSTSMHCHPQKKTSLIILSGNAMNITFLQRRYLRGGDAVMIEKEVFHSTKSLSEEGVFLLEIETPPKKTDLVRLEDRYGRERAGYEGITEMQTQNLKDFGYFCFEEPDSYKRYNHDNGKFSVAFEVFANNEEFQKHFKFRERELYTSCRGSLFDDENKVLLGVGDTQKAEVLSNMKKVCISEKTVLLRTTTKDMN